jgi:hypothetical protein
MFYTVIAGNVKLNEILYIYGRVISKDQDPDPYPIPDFRI